MTGAALRGRLITFEGPEGSGKSTQIKHLRWRLESAGVAVLQTREPGGTLVGEQLRAILLLPGRPTLAPEAEALLLSADRAQHVTEVIRPALNAGMVVICDRYYDSTYAYQGYGAGLELAVLEAVTDFATGGLAPDLTILVDCDVEVGLARRKAAFSLAEGEYNRIDRREGKYHERVRQGFLELARREPDRFLTIDGRQSPEAVFSQIWARVTELFEFPPRSREKINVTQLPLSFRSGVMNAPHMRLPGQPPRHSRRSRPAGSSPPGSSTA